MRHLIQKHTFWLGLAMLGLSFLLGCGKSKINVQTEEVEVKTIYARVSESGVIQPTIDVPVAPDVSGELVQISIQEGDKVKKGDLLLTIRPDDYKAQLEQAQASLSRARAAHLQAKATLAQSKATLLQDSVNRVRTRQLFDDKVVSKVDMEDANLRFQVSKSQYEGSIYNVQSAYYQMKSAEATRTQARQSLDRTNIYASMDGTITLLNVELGQRVVGTGMMSGTEILKIADLSSMEVVVEINENDIVNVSLGDSARIEVDAFPDKIFFGEVTEVAYSATVAGMSATDQVTNFEVKVKVSPASYETALGESWKTRKGESPFRPGMTAFVEIYTEQVTDATVVPLQAVTLRKAKDAGPEASGEETIFLLEGGKVRQQAIQTGIADDISIQVLDGAETGEKVITGPYTTLTRILRDGMEVEEGAAEGRRWEKQD